MLRVLVVAAAALLFILEPVAAKARLPALGGVAGVWAACVMVFQFLLLAGYLYVPWRLKTGDFRRQVREHRRLVAISAGLAPLCLLPPWSPPPGVPPLLVCVADLLLTTGLPIVVLASSSPLLQAWHLKSAPDAPVHRWYALSNAGSLLGLLAFPLWLEWALPLPVVRAGWLAGYLAFVAAWWGWGPGSAPGVVAAGNGTAGWPGGAGREGVPRVPVSPAPASPAARWSRRAAWAGLSAVGSALLLAVSNHVVENAPSVPVLWVLPLAAYLGGFMAAFGRDRSRRSGPVVWFGAGLLGGMALLLITPLRPAALLGYAGRVATTPLAWTAWGSWGTSFPVPVAWTVPVDTAGLAVWTYLLAARLVATRPAADRLPDFYAAIAAGGTGGSLLVNALAPQVCPQFEELPLLLAGLAWSLVFTSHRLARGSAVVLALAVSALGIGYVAGLHVRAIEASRSFYGALRVESIGASPASPGVRLLFNGLSLHGDQDLTGDRRRPPDYYGPASGLGRVLGALPPGPVQLGVAGLGVGALAAYGRAGDRLHFFEVNPDVEPLARRWFTYLADSPASTQVTAGDARVELRRLPGERFDVLVLDAFSGAQIPVHLLTRDAMQEYQQHLTPRGLLVAHVDSFELELVPVLADLAAAAGRRAEYWPATAEAASRWVVIGPADRNRWPAGVPTGRELAPEPGFRPWTDDYTSLLTVWRPLRRWQGKPVY